jgi:hypothetical protein
MIELWHGGRRWEGGAEIQPPKPGRCECGPGIYLTNRYLRARDYAKAGGVTTLVALRDGIRWLEQAERPLAVLQDYVRTTPRFRKRDTVLADLERYAVRTGRNTVPVGNLVNLCVNHDVLSGNQGLQLAEWLSSEGIDASLHEVNGQEQWVIVFNPAAIRRYEVVSASKVTLAQYDLPLIKPTQASGLGEVAAE